MINLLSYLTSNHLINVGFTAWMAAQILKTLFTYIATEHFVPERLVGAGGMPSSHSALVCSIAIAAVRRFGFSSTEFAVTLTLAAIVMYDAMGVRRAAGEQAKVLNKMIERMFQPLDTPEDNKDELMEILPEEPEEKPQKALKEFIGHTPFEVLGGALLGILIAMLFPA